MHVLLLAVDMRLAFGVHQFKVITLSSDDIISSTLVIFGVPYASLLWHLAALWKLL